MKQHHFEIEHAEKYGVSEAIVINCFQYWIDLNRKNGRHQHDGRTWTYNSIKALNDTFSYWTPKQVRRVMENLENKGVLITGNYNEKNYDKTKWYAFVNESEFLKPIAQKGKGSDETHCPKGQSPLPKRANGIAQKGEPIPVNNQLITTVNNEGAPAPKSDYGIKSKKHLELIEKLSGANIDRLTNLSKEKFELLVSWLNHRTAIRNNYQTERGLSTPLKILTEHSHEDAKYIFDYSLNNEYAGLFPEQLEKRDKKPSASITNRLKVERGEEFTRKAEQAAAAVGIKMSVI